MTTTTTHTAIHPGEFIRDEIEERSWSQTDLAYILGKSAQTVNRLLTGKSGITPEMAKALSGAFDVSPELFLNLQRAYDLANAEEPDEGIAKRARLLNVYPIREMVKRGWLEDAGINLMEAQVARFFEVNSVHEIDHLPHAAKKTTYDEIKPRQQAWLYRVKQIAQQMIVSSKYTKPKLRKTVDELRKLRAHPEEVRHVPRLLEQSGVRFVVVEPLPGSKIDGVCFWLDSRAPVIGLSMRFDRIDNFWFVLRHEIEHVLRDHGQDHVIVDAELEGERGATDESVSETERVANIAGADFCVDSKAMESFILRKYPYFYERDVLAFAKAQGTHPGLVVGQIHSRSKKYSYLRKHLSKVREHMASSAVVDGWGDVYPIEI